LLHNAAEVYFLAMGIVLSIC